jgi:hypothetical protein
MQLTGEALNACSRKCCQTQLTAVRQYWRRTLIRIVRYSLGGDAYRSAM